MIADGVCKGYGCLDCEPYCNHTTNPNYALYDQTNKTNEWEKSVVNVNGHKEVGIWEVDPQEVKSKYS